MIRKGTRKPFINVNIVYMLASVVCIVFLLSSIVFLSYAENTGNAQTADYMRESTRQSQMIVESQIASDFSTLSALASVYGSLAKEPNADSLALLRQATMDNRFYSIGLATLDGHGKWVDESGQLQSVNFFPDSSFKRAAEGKQDLSNIITTTETGENVYYYFVPITDGNHVTSVLFASHKLDFIYDVISASTFGQRGFMHIIDNEGNIVIHSKNPLHVKDLNNILDTQNPPLSEDQKSQILLDLSLGEDGFVEQKYDNTIRWAAYSPLSINNWFIFYVMPQDQMIFNYGIISNGLLVIVLSAVSIFVFFVFFIRRINEKSMAQLEELVFTDSLTGQRTFQKFLIDAETFLSERSNSQYSIWYCDIKNFKYINDLFGYSVGDNVLRFWTMVLKQDTRPGEVFGRVGADNFVCLREYTDTKELKTRFDLYAAMLANYNETAEKGFKLEISAGIFLIDPQDSEMTVNDMLDRANVAQKSIKSLSGSRCAIYSNEMRDKILREAEMESRMETSLMDGDFHMYLQPKVAIANGAKVMGAEALVRWQWPDRGLVPPGEFIPLFEKNGFIVRLDEFMLEEACKLLEKDVLEPNTPHFAISVNVSRIGILQHNFIDRYVKIKNKYNVPDGCIELEFTESIAFENHLTFRSIVTELQKNGFLCSLDDFGAGHSSLNILKDLPVDVLKIDRLFFFEGDDSERDKELINSIVGMAKALKMTTVAEGVETMEQVEMLREMSCDIIQGYVFSRPLTVDDFLTFRKKMNA